MRAYRSSIPGSTRAASRGIALITGLVLLVILTIVALSTMRTTSLEYRMSSNTAYSSETRQVSESGRLAVSSVLHEHIFERSWSGVSIPSGCTILDKDSDGAADSLVANSSGEAFDAADLLGSLTDDAQYTDSVNGLTSTISVYHAATKLSAGSGAAMSAGYMGLGKGAGAGGASMYYYVLSEATGHASARSLTSADILTPIGH